MKITFSDEKLEEFCTTGKSDKNEYRCYVRDARFMSGLRRCLTTLLMAQDTVSLSQTILFYIMSSLKII